jgi:hypothetical protein
MQRFIWSKRTGVLTGFVACFTLLLAIIVSPGAAPTSAQDAEPTATPQTPIWLAFSAVREAIEEEESVNLTTVARWQFFQDNWEQPNSQHPQNAAGIDSCVSTTPIIQARPIYHGWTFQITALNGNQYEGRISFDLDDIAICDIMTESVAPTAVPNSQNPDTGDLPDPVAGSGAAGDFELGGHVVSFTGEAFNAMNRSGMTWVKKQLRTEWGVQEGINYINAAKSNGFKILLGVVGDKNAVEQDLDGYAQDYATFVAALAEAGADAIEIWNEPNIDREWPASQISGANYTRLLAVSYNAIKSRNPNTIVVSGAPAPTGFFGAAGCGAGGCNDDVYMQQMANAGAAQYMDCLGLHYNEGIVSPGTFSGDPRGEYPTYYFESMTNRGAAAFPNMPICYTELGYLSAEGMGSGLPGGFAWAQDTSLAEHAAWLAEAASRAAQRGDVRMLIVWNVNFTRWDSDPMGGYAIIRPDGSCPACDALGTVMGG